MSLPDVAERLRLTDADAPPVAEPEPQPAGPDNPGSGQRSRRLSKPSPEAIITAAVVALACGFTFVQLQPSHLFLTTTPSGGDMGAHVWQPAYLRDHLLHHFRLTGWAPSWYAGFPSLLFYFPLPSLLIVVLNVILPYQVAFKLVTVSGLVALPAAAWFFGRMARMPFPGPACLAAATLPFLFSREFTIYGGNIASTMAGEFSFSISLACAFVFLGLVARGLDTGKYRALAAVALTVTGLCHLLPTIFAIVGALVLTVMRLDRRRWLWTIPTLVVSGLLAAFWSLPFLFRLPYATDMGYEKITQYTKNLFHTSPIAPPIWLFVMAGFGAFVSLLRRNRVGIFLAIMAPLSALAFVLAPQARLWNARILPFWFLSLYLLAGVAVAEGGAMIAESVTQDDHAWARRWTLLPIPVAALGAALIWVCFPLRNLPLGHVDARTGQYRWLGISSSDSSFIPGWVKWNYEGYESTGKAREAEYFGLVKTMSDLGRTQGCGRAMWEYEPELDQMGTPMALMLLPYWTHECIGSMEGLYFESSATTPYHFLNAAELSLKPSNPVRGLDYVSAPDVAAGVAHLQMLGVKYYMALTPETQAQADVNSELRLVATSGPWNVNYASGTPATQQRTWKIYVVQGSEVVAPLLNQPVVMKGVPKGGNGWLQASEKWYLDPSRRDVFYAASGPASWARVAPTEPDPPRTPLAPVQVSNLHTGDDSVSFDVDKTGVPVLVKVSYFPNWHASGAKGPWRVTPNLMVVIPTSHHVHLKYGYTPVDVIGILLSLLGVAGLVWMSRAAAVRFKTPAHFRRPVPPGGTAAVAGLTDPYARLERELAGAFVGPAPSGASRDAHDGDLDGWLGFPTGLDLAHYEAGDHGAARRPPGKVGPITSEAAIWAHQDSAGRGAGPDGGAGAPTEAAERRDGSEPAPAVDGGGPVGAGERPAGSEPAPADDAGGAGAAGERPGGRAEPGG